MQPDDVNLWYVKPKSFDLTEFIVWNIKGLRHLVAKHRNHSLWQIALLHFIETDAKKTCVMIITLEKKSVFVLGINEGPTNKET